MKNKITSFLKQEIVLCIALLLAGISSFAVPPSEKYVSYIDFRVLILLYALMMVVAGLKSLGVFKMMGEKLCRHTKTARGLNICLICLCFFSSMLITNDVALITFVPFTISLFAMARLEDYLISTIVLETIAANLGSMLTPIGNPQNLLLFSKADMTVGDFVLHMLPLTLVSFVLIMVLTLGIKNASVITVSEKNEDPLVYRDWKFWIYIALFLVCLGNVFHLYSHIFVGIVVTIVLLIVNRSLFKQVDYSLLFTFVGFFIFIGNMKQLEGVNTWLLSIISGHEIEVSILASQIISNVPAAMLLSGFSDNYSALMIGVNAGGLGTLIASMASLISYRFFVKAYPEKKGVYFKSFTIYNFGLLAVIYIFVLLFLS